MRRSAGRSSGRIVWHVGRSGEVAGGMTQVVNGYLAWPFETWTVRVIHSRDGGRGPRSALLPLRALLRIALLGSRRRNLVVVHLSQGGSFVREGALLRAAALLGYRTVAHLHGSGFVEYAADSPGRVRSVLAAASRVFVLSAATRDCAAQFVPAGRVELVPNAVAAGADGPKCRSVVFGGTVSRRKGVDVLVSAWSRLAPPAAWSLEIVGPAGDPELVDQGVSGATFRGALPHQELMGLLEQASIAVLPSRDEAMPMFILEALARRTAVVATRVGGIPDVLSDGAGVLVDPGDIDGLAAALGDLMQDEEARAKVGATGGERFARRYSAQAVYPLLELSWASALEADRG